MFLRPPSFWLLLHPGPGDRSRICLVMERAMGLWSTWHVSVAFSLSLSLALSLVWTVCLPWRRLPELILLARGVRAARTHSHRNRSHRPSSRSRARCRQMRPGPVRKRRHGVALAIAWKSLCARRGGCCAVETRQSTPDSDKPDFFLIVLAREARMKVPRGRGWPR